MNRLRPFSLTIAAVLLFGVWSWIDMSNMNYRAGQPGSGRTTAGWFTLGLPMLVCVGLLMSMPFSLAARRAGLIFGWIILLTTFMVLLTLAVLHTTPAARLKWALGVELPPETRIDRIRKTDTFNDGSRIWGICSANRALVDELIAAHSLEPHLETGDLLLQCFPGEPIPEIREELSGSGLSCYYDAERSLLYFYRRFTNID